MLSRLAVAAIALAGCTPPADVARSSLLAGAGPGPARFLPVEARSRFFAGRALASQPWVKAPSITDARDGLGPLYNAASCLGCHPGGGRGRPAKDGDALVATVARLATGALEVDPVYGGQLQTRSVALTDQLRVAPGVDLGAAPAELVPEARVRLTWTEVPFTYPDGTVVQLRAPRVELDSLAHGPLDPRVRVVLRHAPPLWGGGLLARVPTADLERQADPDDVDGDGVSGRVARLPPSGHPGSRDAGRFGWKAVQPTLRAQVAAALHQDMGLTSSPFPEPPCTPRQHACRALPSGAGAEEVEVPDRLLELLVHFCDAAGVPAARPASGDHPARGRELFARAGCEGCHSPRLRTGEDVVRGASRQEIWPYTDLLLHDLGAGLADPRGEGGALPGEWRTPPLWGLGSTVDLEHDAGLLHDGRARTVEEAILWHDGEAGGARQRFTALTAADRTAVVQFLSSL